MTKEELAAKLNGREYGHEITGVEESAAKAAELLVIFGASDDLCELRGAIHDEVDACNGTTVAIANGALVPRIDREDKEVLEKYDVLSTIQNRHVNAIKVKAAWCEVPGYSWTISTDEPHAAFDIMEDGETFCRGIVLDLKPTTSKPQEFRAG